MDVSGYRYQLANSLVDVDVVDYSGDDCLSLPCTYYAVPSSCTATFTTSSLAAIIIAKAWNAPFIATSTGVFSVVDWLPNPTTSSMIDTSVSGFVAMSDYGWQARILLQCAIPCPPGAILVGNSCVNCSVGTYPSTRTACSACTNGLANTVYTSFGSGNNCSFACVSGKYLTSTYTPTLLVGDTTSPGALRVVSATGYVTTIYTAPSPADPLYNLRFVTMSLDRQIAYVGMYAISRFNITSRTATSPFVGSNTLRGSADGMGTSATFNAISSVALWQSESYLVVADGGNCNIRLVAVPSYIVTTVAGLAGSCGFVDDVGLAARFRTMSDVVVNSDSNIAYVADPLNCRVRALFLMNQTVVTIAGNGANTDTNGIGTAASIVPQYLTLVGNVLYVKTVFGVRKIDLNTMAVSTLTSSLANSPMQMAVSSSGQYLYYGSYYKVSSFFTPLKTSIDIAGSSAYGFYDGQGANARFRTPQAVILLSEIVQPNAVCLQCTSCDAGSYGVCTANSSDCYPCPANQFSAAGASACSFCAPGKFASGGVCTSCLAGTYAVAGDTTCSACGIGNFSLAGASACSPCPNGTYANAGVCVTCPRGAFSLSASTVCTNCSAGTMLQAGVCVNCSAGWYSTEGSTMCYRCVNLPGNASYAGQGGTNSTNCDYACNSGFSYVPSDGSCSICAPGNWTSRSMVSCQPCTNLPPNATYSGVGSNESNCPISCFSGYYLSRYNASLCLPCAPGTRMVAGVCVPCPVGGYSLGGGSTCLPCSNGNYALGNATACTSCPNQSPYTTFIGRGTNAACSFVCSAGSFVFNRTTCVPCTAGTYASTPGRTVCSVCTDGKWSDAGATACTSCSYLNITAVYNGTICSNYPAICKAGFAVSSVVCVP